MFIPVNVTVLQQLLRAKSEVSSSELIRQDTDSKDTTDPNVLDWKAKLQYMILISLAPNTLTYRTRNGINTK